MGAVQTTPAVHASCGRRHVSGSLPPLQRYDGRWTVLPHSEVSKLFTGNADEKRFTQHNYIPLLSRWVKHGDTVFDVGASYGDEVIDLALLVGPPGKVYAFEPDADSFEALKATMKANGLDNVVCINAAVSNFETPGAITLDTYWDSVGRPAVQFIKIDTDGHEIAVLEGAKQMLAENPSCPVLAEYLPGLNYSGRRAADVLHWYEEQGLEVHALRMATERIDDPVAFAKTMAAAGSGICHDVLLRRSHV